MKDAKVGGCSGVRRRVSVKFGLMGRRVLVELGWMGSRGEVGER